MKPTVITKTCKLPDGREITIETGKLARLADGSVVLRMGNTMLLATVVSAQEAKPGTDFFTPFRGLPGEIRRYGQGAGRFSET